MWSKIYLAVLGLSIAVMAFFTFYSWSWLQSIGLPDAAIAGYKYHFGLAFATFWLSSATLLILGNAVLWASGRAWAMWTAFLYFAVFEIIREFWLNRAFLAFHERNGWPDYDLVISGFRFGAVIFIVLMAVIVFFDMFFVIRMRARAYPIEEKAEAETETTTE